MCSLHFPGPILFIFHPLFQLTTHSPSLQKASCSNACLTFSNCIQNDVTSVLFCQTTFRKKIVNYSDYVGIVNHAGPCYLPSQEIVSQLFQPNQTRLIICRILIHVFIKYRQSPIYFTFSYKTLLVISFQMWRSSKAACAFKA